MRRAIFILVGLALGVGVALAQTNPWWHPLNPQGGSHGVTYGTVLPTLANTGLQPTDGLLAVQITAGAAPTLNMYDQSTTAWLTFGLTPAGGLTNDTVPVWDTGTTSFGDSTITDDGTTTAITTQDVNIIVTDDVTIDTSAGDDILLTTGDVVTIAGGELLLPDGVVGGPAMSFTNAATSGWYLEAGPTLSFAVAGVRQMAVTGSVFNHYGLTGFSSGTVAAPGARWVSDPDSGDYLIGAGNIGRAVGGALVQAWEDTNAAGAGATLTTISSTLGIMDDAADVFTAQLFSLTNANHTAAVSSPLVIGSSYVLDAGDAEAYETAVAISANWDTHMTFTDIGASPPNNPPAGNIGMFVDGNADYSGGGGNDCILGLIDSTGAIDIVTTIVLNGACP